MTFTLAPKSGAAPMAYQAVASSTPIPFRKTAIVSGSEVVGLVVTTVLILAAGAVLAWFARRHGWLDRWIGGVSSARNTTRSLAVLEVLRISRKTTLYRVSNGKREFVLAESSARIQLSSTQVESEHVA